MRVRHWLAEGAILALVAFATFAQAAAGNGVKAASNTSEETTSAKTNSTSSRTPAPVDQKQDQKQQAASNSDKNSNAPDSANAAPASTPVAAAGSDQQSEASSQSATDAAAGETTVQKPDTLGEAARKAREEKKASPPAAKRTAKVFTNEDVEDANGISVVGTSAPAADNSAPAKSGGLLADQEKDWRGRFAKARAKLQRDQAELDVDQRELGKLRLQFYPNDPSKQLSQSITNEDVNKQQDKIDKERQAIQNDQDDIATLEDQLRRSGGDSGWARP